MKVIVWSKNNCQYCDKAKLLLKLNNIDYEERNIEKDWSKEQLLNAAPLARTLPQVVINDKLIGGFTELQKYLA
jgi:glutaredoxin